MRCGFSPGRICEDEGVMGRRKKAVGPFFLLEFNQSLPRHEVASFG